MEVYFAIILSVFAGFVVGSYSMYAAWKKCAVEGYFTIGGELYTTKHIDPRNPKGPGS